MTTYQQRFINRFLAQTRELAEYLVLDCGGVADQERIRQDAGALAAGLLELDQWLSRGGPLPAAWQQGRTVDNGHPDELSYEQTEAALLSAEMLVHAYECGQANSGSVDWAQLDAAYEAALKVARPQPSAPGRRVP